MNSLRCAGFRLSGVCRSITAVTVPSRRYTHHDGTRRMSGEREVVGYGINGSPIYIDCSDFPFPAIRYREATPESCSLREKEQGDWKKLSLLEKKTLYRHSFCQTYAEFQHFTPEWKLAVGIALWATAIGILVSMVINENLYPDLPETYDDEHRQAQLRRIIHLQINPITGVASDWDYSKNKWK